MIDLTSFSPVAITSMVKFPCLLIFNFKYTSFFFNVINTEVMAVLAKISMCIFVFIYLFWLGGNLAKCHTDIKSACFYQSIRDEIVSYCFLIFLNSNYSWCFFFKKVSFRLPHLSLCLVSSLSLCIMWRGKTPGKLSKTPGKLLEFVW